MDTALPSPAVHAATGDTPASRVRIESIDLLRGIIMIIMALDHVHDFFGALDVSPTNLAVTTAPLFLTRWITHFCAPVFFLLTGTSACLTLQRMSLGELSRFLLTRGVWLIVLEVVVMRFALQFNVDYRVTLLTVLWALGWAMISLAGSIHLPVRALVVLGVAMVAGHNLLDGIGADACGMFRSPDLGHFPFTAPPEWDAGLPAIYLLWACVVLALYPLCRWYAGLKRRRKDWWLSYL